jgi:NAD(P)H-dependent FMN reductase
MSKKIQLIIGSTRENRVAPQVAAWVASQVAKNSDIELEVVDLKEWDLPFMNAPVAPAYAPVDTPEAKKWAAQIGKAEGYIFLTAEYNRGIPAPLKNAIDYLTTEWKEKPAAIVSYGYIDGGGSAARHLNDVMDWLKIRAVEPKVALQLSQDIFDETGALKDSQAAFAENEADISAALAQLAA